MCNLKTNKIKQQKTKPYNRHSFKKNKASNFAGCDYKHNRHTTNTATTTNYNNNNNNNRNNNFNGIFQFNCMTSIMDIICA